MAVTKILLLTFVLTMFACMVTAQFDDFGFGFGKPGKPFGKPGFGGFGGGKPGFGGLGGKPGKPGSFGGFGGFGLGDLYRHQGPEDIGSAYNKGEAAPTYN